MRRSARCPPQCHCMGFGYRRPGQRLHSYYVVQGAGYAGETVNTTITEIDFNTPPTLRRRLRRRRLRARQTRRMAR